MNTVDEVLATYAVISPEVSLDTQLEQRVYKGVDGQLKATGCAEIRITTIEHDGYVVVVGTGLQPQRVKDLIEHKDAIFQNFLDLQARARIA